MKYQKHRVKCNIDGTSRLSDSDEENEFIFSNKKVIKQKPKEYRDKITG